MKHPLLALVAVLATTVMSKPHTRQTDSCSIAREDRRGCGSHDTQHVGCVARGCCWDDCGDCGRTVPRCFLGFSQIRLVDGPEGSVQGRLEILHEGEWGTVCDDNFGLSEARVVCSQLGSSGGSVREGAFFGQGEGPLWLDEVRCHGNEEDLHFCDHSGWGTTDCSHWEDVGVICGEDVPAPEGHPLNGSEGMIRLVNGTMGPLSGRIEVYHEREWGTICDDNFSAAEAAVVCQELGSYGGTVYPSAFFGQGTGPIWMDQLSCYGSEWHLSHCSFDGWGEHDCMHVEDVGVVCGTDDTTHDTGHEGQIRLVGSAVDHMGRLEIYHDFRWGTVCDDGIGLTEAAVVCNELGYSGGSLAWYGPGIGPIHLDSVDCSGGDFQNLFECAHDAWGEHDCSHSEDVAIACDIPNMEPVRLVDGNFPNEGRLEIFHSGEWGTVCDDWFDESSATVVCRQLGYASGTARGHALYGPGSGPIHLDDVMCHGMEETLSGCLHNDWGVHDCSHAEDVSVICDNTGNDNTTSDYPVRLVDGDSESNGRVEIFFNGEWGTVCDDSFDDREAQVICRELGYDGGEAFSRAHYGEGSGLIHLDEVECDGSEPMLALCAHSPWGYHDCAHAEDAAVECLAEGVHEVRLVNGSHPAEGRLEILHEGEWGTVCDDFFDDITAQVVCNMLGYEGGQAEDASFFGEGTGPIHLDTVMCYGHETALDYCFHDDWGVNDCTHAEDVSVICIDAGMTINVTQTTRTTHPVEVSTAEAAPTPAYPVRLVDGLSDHEGRVEILYEGQWGTVCDDFWGDVDAEVVCRQMGFAGGVALHEAHHGPGEPDSIIWLDTVRCRGSEAELADCVHDEWSMHDCTHEEDASVRCDLPDGPAGPSSSFLEVRLADGETSAEGRVEVHYAGQWGTVCDDFFDDSDANVVCRQLGFDFGQAYLEAPFGAGAEETPIWLDTVECFGDEVSLGGCSHQPFGMHDCTHDEDVGVRCDDYTAEETPIGMVRLRGGERVSEGRVEVFWDGEWGTVCDDYWDKADASVVCRSLGYASGYASGNAHYGPGTGPIHMDNLGCFGDEVSLLDCPYRHGEDVDCDHGEDAGALCNTEDPYIPNQQNEVRLANGPDPLSGRVEVFHNGQWGSICDDHFDDHSAHVVCRQLGLEGGTAFGEAHFGSGEGPIWIDDVTCFGYEDRITDCLHGPWQMGDCGHLEDAGVVCDPPLDGSMTNLTVRLVDGRVPSEGRVEVYHEGAWGTICDDLWSDASASVVCRQLGYEYGFAYHEAFFGPGQGDIWLNRVRCDGEEADVADCDHHAWGHHTCSHAEDAAVRCDYLYGMTYVRNYELRLVSGSVAREGRLEVFHGGEWGTVCDDHWGEEEADVVCRELGYTGGTAVTEGYFGQGVGPIHLDGVQCQGAEDVLDHCHRGEWGGHDCTHAEDAGVICEPW